MWIERVREREGYRGRKGKGERERDLAKATE
jgi:hypothetical protein